ncbi:MAG: GNAT family N-acetyltransferase [Haloarculaceae archaeon]
MPQTGEPTTDDDYECRPAALDRDRDAFLSLYRTVWGRTRRPAWFDWRFRDNPVGDARITVVTDGDGVVGAEACLPYRLREGDRTLLALQPVDWIVHPDHRKRGLARRMTERRIEADADADLYFNFPTDALQPLLFDLGWRVVGEQTTFYRLQDPATVGRLGGDSTVASVLGRLSAPLAKGYLRASDWRTSGGEDVTVERHASPPADELARLHRRHRPAEIHVDRDAAYYRWRFANPRWDCQSYLARRDGEVVAALVTCSEAVGGVRVTRLAEALPLVDGPTDAFAALVAAAVEDHRQADVLKTTAGTLPPSVLRHCGFRSDDGALVARVATKTTHVVRPLADDWTPGDVPLDEQTAWRLAFAETDIA